MIQFPIVKHYPTILAIDFGTKRIGLAISRGSLAEPLQIVTNDQQTATVLAEICQREGVTQLVVGLSENEMARQTKAFVTELQKSLKLPLVFMDETLSSKTVGAKLKERGVTLKKRQQPIDHLAAAEFLQEYLDLQQG